MKSRAVVWVESHPALPASLLVLGVYGFVVSLTGFQAAWNLAFSPGGSGDVVQSALDASLATPFTSLLSGIVITSLVQSSSASIALVVATAASGVIAVPDTVFILMGANIGTTVTNTIVGLAHSHRRSEFEQLLPAILVDDIFKILNVALFFFIELSTGLLHGLSLAIVDFLSSGLLMGSFLEMFPDVIDLLTTPVTISVIGAITGLPASIGVQALLTGGFFFFLLIGSLSLMGETLEIYLHDRSRRLIDRVFKGRLVSLIIGFTVCWLLQSSSVTVSLILPLVTQAAVTLPAVYYYSIGAALATTCDPAQLLSYLKFGPIGLTAGLVHILLNIFGAVLFAAVPGLRTLPIVLAEGLTRQICRFRHAPMVLVGYVAAIFFGLPLGVIYLIGGG